MKTSSVARYPSIRCGRPRRRNQSFGRAQQLLVDAARSGHRRSLTQKRCHRAAAPVLSPPVGGPTQPRPGGHVRMTSTTPGPARPLRSPSLVLLLAAGCTDDGAATATTAPARTARRPEGDGDGPSSTPTRRPPTPSFEVAPGRRDRHRHRRRAGPRPHAGRTTRARSSSRLVDRRRGPGPLRLRPRRVPDLRDRRGRHLADGRRAPARSPAPTRCATRRAEPVAVSEPFEVIGPRRRPRGVVLRGPGDRRRLRLRHHARRRRSSASTSRCPGPIEDGPYPTVIEYSGYGPSNPDRRPSPAR